MSDDHEVKKVKALLVEILLNPNWVDLDEEFKWNVKYNQHTTLAGELHFRRLIKYGQNGSHVYPNYVITDRGRKYLERS